MLPVCQDRACAERSRCFQGNCSTCPRPAPSSRPAGPSTNTAREPLSRWSWERPCCIGLTWPGRLMVLSNPRKEKVKANRTAPSVNNLKTRKMATYLRYPRSLMSIGLRLEHWQYRTLNSARVRGQETGRPGRFVLVVKASSNGHIPPY